MILSGRRVITVAAVLVLAAVMVVALVVPSAVSTWLGIAALCVVGWPIVVEVKTPPVIAVGHLGVIASCFALGLHDEHRTVWLTMLATFTALPLAWAARRSGRAAKAAGGLVTAGVTFGVFAWSAEQLNGPLSSLRQLLLFGTGAGLVLIVQALRRTKPPSAPTAIIEPEPPGKPTLPEWARDVSGAACVTSPGAAEGSLRASPAPFGTAH